MLIGVIADDFTGAGDIANTLARGAGSEGGLRAALLPGVPDGPAPAGVEAGVVALKIRSVDPDVAVAQALAALDWLRAQGCGQVIYKVCSTFDSTARGNIGPVSLALAAALGVRGVAVCPAFPRLGRTVYQGHLFVADRLLNESGMQHHPLTPMTDPDLRRVLARQLTEDAGPVGHVALPVVAEGPGALRAGLAAQSGVLAIVDAVSDTDLLTLGAALDGAALAVGGSGIALGLPRNLIRAGRATGGVAPLAPVSGPGAILAGSCSGATLAQIARHRQQHPALPVDPAQVMAGTQTAQTLVDFIAAHPDGAPLVHSSDRPEQVRAAQDRFGRAVVAGALDRLFAETACMLIARGWRRLVVAGGETSGAVAQALAEATRAQALHIGPEIDPGVPILTMEAAPPVALALKSGNFGGEDFLARALAAMEGRA